MSNEFTRKVQDVNDFRQRLSDVGYGLEYSSGSRGRRLGQLPRAPREGAPKRGKQK